LAEWWESYFDALYLTEHAPLFGERRERKFVGRLIDLMALPLGSRVLDCPCGQGRHSRLLAEAGYRVAGLDFSRHLLSTARRTGTMKGLTYARGDMRHLPASWTGRYNAVLNLFSSFGFFLDPADDARVISEWSRVLVPGGVLIWHGGNRDVIATRMASRDWWRAEDGTHIAQERFFDQLSGVLTVSTSWISRNETTKREHRIRLYTATRLAEILASHRLVVEQALDGESGGPLSRRSGTMTLLARKE
jgi:ubiquinone/menaquinone biosynthesis C-methylase UbiE